MSADHWSSGYDGRPFSGRGEFDSRMVLSPSIQAHGPRKEQNGGEYIARLVSVAFAADPVPADAAAGLGVASTSSARVAGCSGDPFLSVRGRSPTVEAASCIGVPARVRLPSAALRATQEAIDRG